MHYNPMNNVVKECNVLGIFLKGGMCWDSTDLNQSSWTFHSLNKDLLRAFYVPATTDSKMDRISRGTYRLTRETDIKRRLQKTIANIIKDMMKYRVLRIYKREHLPNLKGRVGSDTSGLWGGGLGVWE